MKHDSWRNYIPSSCTIRMCADDSVKLEQCLQIFLSTEAVERTRIEPVGEPYREVCLSP